MPNARIDILVRAGNESLFTNHPFLGRVLVWNKRDRKYRNLLRLALDVRQEHYDAVVNLQRHTASAAITLFSRAKETAGFDENFLSRFFTYRKTHRLGKAGDSSYLHEVQRCIALLEQWTPVDFTGPKLYPSSSDYAAVEGYCNEPFITISPSSVWMTKQTPSEVWQQLILATKQRVFLLGAPADGALCE